ncbi:MAG: sodium:proton exchanger [Thermoleophilia bacterium]|nr:sodium:proton exchanger [Thermoleophilia bacterium]
MGITRTEAIVITAIFAVTAVAGTMFYANGASFSSFLVATAALAGLAWVVSFATEQLGERMGPAATGILQSTLGNLPEFFVVLFALRAGQVEVAKFSIIGSIFANALFVLGLAIIAGAWKSPDKAMRFSPRLPNDTATLMLLATFIIATIGISASSHDRASGHITAISVGGAVVLLLVYLAWVWSYLKGGAESDPAHHAKPRVSALATIVLLAVAGVCAAFVSDWFVAGLEPAINKLNISAAFAGLVIVAIAGNAIENVAGVVLAWKGQNDLSISVVKNSVAQISVFLFPLLVLVSLTLSHQLTFQLDPVWIGALALTGIIIWQVTGDGVALVWEGVALVGFYFILAMVAYFE